MEGKKLEKKLRDWASELCFKLPDGSAPPANYFALLTATPHRRQLWEALVESVQPRQKIEHMRRQIMVAKIRDRRTVSRKGDSAFALDRIELWCKRRMLKKQLKEKEDEMIKVEGIIIARVSDMLFEICKLAELEKLYEESSEKALTLRLFTKRERDMIKCLERILLKVMGPVLCSQYFDVHRPMKSVEPLKDDLLAAEECVNPLSYGHECKLGNTLEELEELGISEDSLWEEVVKCKKTLLSKFTAFLEELNSDEKSVLSGKEVALEEGVNMSVKHLKQKATAKSLQVILNSTEGQELEWEIEKLEEVLYKGEKKSSEVTFPLATGGTSDSVLENEKAAKSIKKCVSSVGLRCYKEFLLEESKRLGEEIRTWGKEGCEKGEKELERTTMEVVTFFDTIVEEINSQRSKGKDVADEVLRSYERLVCQVRSMKEDAEEEKKRARAMEDADKLKGASGRLIDVFMETPLDAFRTVESCSGRNSSECDALSHCLNTYGGELNQFFGAVLIPPQANLRPILSELEARKNVAAEVRNIIRRRGELAQLQRKIQHEVNSITLDVKLCERNFEESASTLWNVLSRSDELLRETDLIEGILRNWVEQPYRWMAGKT